MREKPDIFMDLCQLVLSTAAIELVLLVVPGTIAMFTGKNEAAPLMTQLIVRPADLLLIIALLAMLATLWIYLHWVLPYAGERPWDQVVTLFLALLLFLTNYFVMVPTLFPFRFFFVAGVLGMCWYKDVVLAKRFAGTDYGATVNEWRRNVRWTFLFTTVAACCFAALSHPLFWLVVSKSLFGRPVRFGHLYEIILAAAFNVAFLVISTRSLMKNFAYFGQHGEHDLKALHLWTEKAHSKPSIGA